MVDYSENVLERRGTSGRDHIPSLPFWFAIIRVVQLVFAFIVLVLTAYSSDTFGGADSIVVSTLFPGYSMSFFTFAWTVLFLLYILLTPLAFPKFYHSYIHIGLEFLTVVFWLTTFALLADECKWWVAEQNSLKDYKKYYGSNHEYDKLITASKASRAATGIAAIVWILFMITFGFVIFFWNRHRTGNSATGLAFGGPPVPTGEAEKTHEPVELHNVPGQPQYPAATTQV